MINRWLALAFVALLLVVIWIGVERYAPGGIDTARLVYLVMALLVVSGAGFGFRRIRFDRASAVAGVLFWGAAIALLVVGYNLFNR